MFFQFDVNKLIIQLLPPPIRKLSIYSFLQAMLYPVKQLHATFAAYKLTVDRKLTYNSFQNYLERFLNGIFYFDYKAIYITDEENSWTDLAYQYEGASPDYMSFQNEIPSSALELSSMNPDNTFGRFIVHVPAALSQADIATVRNWVNYYKIAGTEFSIEIYG